MSKQSVEKIESIGSIMFTIENDGLKVEPVELDVRTSGRFKENLSVLSSPSVCVIDAAHLGLLRCIEFQDIIVDRGKKTTQPLTRYFCGQKKIPVLEAEYGSAGKLKGPVEAFLLKAVSGDDPCEANYVGILGIPKRVYEDLVKQIEGGVQKKTRAQEPSTLLMRLKADKVEPEELSKAFVGRSEDAQIVRQLILRAADTKNPVLILGDSGTGKEVVAREIHKYSSRGSRDLVTLNCAAISPYLLEMELFGCEPGVTGHKHRGKKGLWEEAHGSTLFLDEIGDLIIDHQAKILRALQEGKFRRVGGEKDIVSNARIVAATNKDVFAMAQTNDFREDLYYRLRGFVIRTSPLRQHPDDIPLLAQEFWKKLAGEKAKSLSPEIIDRLKSYSWPGNARDLQLVLSSLRTLYPKQAQAGDLQVLHLEDAFHQRGHEDGCQKSTIPFDLLPRVLRIDSLRHLNRVFDILYATQLAIHPLVQRKRQQQQTIEDVQTSLELRRQELEICCKNDRLFNNKSLFLDVFNILGMLMAFQTELYEDPEKARNDWDLELSKKVSQVIDTLKKEISQVRENA